MFVLPTASALARPIELTVATDVLEEFQVTAEVMLAVEPSL